MINAKHADHRSDIYSLGGVLYRLLTGTLPFKAESAGELLLAKEQGRFTPARRTNREVPERLDLMLDKMLSKDLKYRYQSYGELIRDLKNLEMVSEHLSIKFRRRVK